MVEGIIARIHLGLLKTRIKIFVSCVNTHTHTLTWHPPSCERDYDRIYETLLTRITVVELLCHCTHRTSGIGVLTPDLLLHILGFVRVCYM